jgi:dipeptidyl aminopeptidase/acylaminoacyl peptidase
LGVWFADGVRIAHSRPEDGGEAVVVRRLDGAGGDRVIHKADHPVGTTDVTPDGRGVLFSDYGRRNGRIYISSAEGGSPPRELRAEGEGYEQAARISPDGRWLAYITTKTRREEVCVRRLDGSGGSWQVSTGGGGGVRWGRDGHEVFFVTGEMLMRAAIVVHGDDLSVGVPAPLFEVPPSPTEASYRDYAYDPVSDRFLFTRPPKGSSEMREIAVSLGWAGRLADKVQKSAGR